EKSLPKKELYEIASALKKLTTKYGAIFIVNDYVELAKAVGANGVHLGQDDMPLKEARAILGKSKIIGISTHTFQEALKAEAEGADYIGFGPIYTTKTKDAGDPKGCMALRELKSLLNIPIVAIGGININNLREVVATGVDAVASISALLSGDNIKENIATFLYYLEIYRKD
ncbi:MAG: thiamine phosphate synthase, partial [Nitrospirae bacterium]